jgi:Zn-dependent protease with chaperone function
MGQTSTPGGGTDVSARYYDGRTSGATAVRLSFGCGGLVTLKSAAYSANYKLEDLDISTRIGDTPRLIGLPDGGKCEVNDNDAIDRLLKEQATNRGGWLHTLESHYLFVMVAILLTVATSIMTFRYGLPWLAERSAHALPQSVDRSLGKGTLDILDRSLLSPSTLDPAIQARLGRRFAEMITTLPAGRDYRLLFRAGNSVGANAFALPSGTIVMTDELVAASENDDELVAILAHEIGHLEYRHSIRMAMQSSAVALIIAAVSGDVVSSSSLLVALPTILIHSSYSQEFEAEADDYAWHYLVDNDIPTGSFASILSRIAADKRDSVVRRYLSSHPGTDARIQRFIE